jgi:hypothetical protein
MNYRKASDIINWLEGYTQACAGLCAEATLRGHTYSAQLYAESWEEWQDRTAWFKRGVWLPPSPIAVVEP